MVMQWHTRVGFGIWYTDMTWRIVGSPPSEDTILPKPYLAILEREMDDVLPRFTCAILFN